MPQTQSRENAASLEAPAAAHFKRKFTKAEKNLLESALLGELADCGVPGDATDPGNNPGKADGWGPDREIDADLIRGSRDLPGYLAGGMVPSKKDACDTDKALRKVPGHYPKFSPFIYSLENSQPIPPPATAQTPLAGRWKRFNRFVSLPRFLRWFLWAQILLGWLLATLFLAGVSGVIRKD